MALTGQDFRTYQGEQRTLRFTIKTAAGQPLDLSALSLSWKVTNWVRLRTVLTKSTPDFTLVDVDGTNDGAEITLSATDTNRDLGGYPHLLRVGGDVVLTGQWSIDAAP